MCYIFVLVKKFGLSFFPMMSDNFLNYHLLRFRFITIEISRIYIKIIKSKAAQLFISLDNTRNINR